MCSTGFMYLRGSWLKVNSMLSCNRADLIVERELVMTKLGENWRKIPKKCSLVVGYVFIKYLCDSNGTIKTKEIIVDNSFTYFFLSIRFLSAHIGSQHSKSASQAV